VLARSITVGLINTGFAGADRGRLLIITNHRTLAPRSMANCTARRARAGLGVRRNAASNYLVRVQSFRMRKQLRVNSLVTAWTAHHGDVVAPAAALKAAKDLPGAPATYSKAAHRVPCRSNARQR
jgi:hypothetical protein